MNAGDNCKLVVIEDSIYVVHECGELPERQMLSRVIA